MTPHQALGQHHQRPPAPLHALQIWDTVCYIPKHETGKQDFEYENWIGKLKLPGATIFVPNLLDKMVYIGPNIPIGI